MVELRGKIRQDKVCLRNTQNLHSSDSTMLPFRQEVSGVSIACILGLKY